MDSDYKKIKEISIVSHCKRDDGYKDLLRISKHCISYKRTGEKSDEEIYHWSYKTTSNVFDRSYEDICDYLYHEFNAPHPDYDKESLFDFNIRITYKDGTHEDIHKNGTFSDNDMSIHAVMFYKIIPQFEPFPDVITIFKNTYLNSNVLSKINRDSINGFMYAEGGAMGCPGCIELITEGYNRFYTRGIYGKTTDVSQFDVAELLEGFEHIATYQRKSLEILKINGENWINLNLGAGNHLFLRHDMYRDFGNMLLDVEHPTMYGKWRRLVDNCEEEMKKRFGNALSPLRRERISVRTVYPLMKN